jgi:hypothetical protein
MDFIARTHPPLDTSDPFPLFDFDSLKTTRKLPKDFTQQSIMMEIEPTQTNTTMNDYCATIIIQLIALVIIAMYLIAFTQGLWWPEVK